LSVFFTHRVFAVYSRAIPPRRDSCEIFFSSSPLRVLVDCFKIPRGTLLFDPCFLFKVFPPLRSCARYRGTRVVPKGLFTSACSPFSPLGNDPSSSVFLSMSSLSEFVGISFLLLCESFGIHTISVGLFPPFRNCHVRAVPPFVLPPELELLFFPDEYLDHGF